MKIKYLILLFFLNPCLSITQDTIFFAKHNFPSPVRNVLKAGDYIYTKTGDGLYKYTEKGWEFVETSFKKTFVYYDNDFFESDYHIAKYSFYADDMAHLIPQASLSNGSMAKKGDRMFVCVGGSLFEYFINPYYWHTYKGISVRDIFMEDSLSIISTYSGIFINDSIRAEKPTYSSGALCKIGNRYFLCQDLLYEFKKPSEFTLIPGLESNTLGLIQKMVPLNGLVYTQHTRTINRYDSLKGLKTIHDGYEYYDLEAFDGKLFACTTTGEVFSYSDSGISLLFDINTPIRDIYPFRDVLYFASNSGVYTIKSGDPSTLNLIAALPNSVNVKIDKGNNKWIATENGLYVIPDKYSEAIPFIPNIEFNRGALTIFKDTLFAGSINGIYGIDIYLVLKEFLAQHLNKKDISDTKSFRIKLTIFITLLLITIAVSIYYFRFRKITIPQTSKDKTVITLNQIEIDINANNITTVEGLAAFYETNPVQLNRLFKTFDTTPGKYLKKVKLNHAKELLKKGASMEDIVSQTGYTAHYIKDHLLK